MKIEKVDNNVKETLEPHSLLITGLQYCNIKIEVKSFRIHVEADNGDLVYASTHPRAPPPASPKTHPPTPTSTSADTRYNN